MKVLSKKVILKQLNKLLHKRYNEILSVELIPPKYEPVYDSSLENLYTLIEPKKIIITLDSPILKNGR